MIQIIHRYSLSWQDWWRDFWTHHEKLSRTRWPSIRKTREAGRRVDEEPWWEKEVARFHWEVGLFFCSFAYRFFSLQAWTCVLIISFISSYKDKVTDYNFGCLIRSDSRGEYGEQNTIFGEFLSICFMLSCNQISPVTRIQVCLSCEYPCLEKLNMSSL